MNDDDIERALRAARPHTPADDEWVASADGERALAEIRSAAFAAQPAVVTRLRRARPLALGVGFVAAAAAVVAVALTTSSAPHRDTPVAVFPSTEPVRPGVGPTPQHMDLVAFDNCTAMLDGLRAHTAKHVGAFGVGDNRFGLADGVGKIAPAVSGAALTAGQASAPDHSTTNVQEIGVGEPDTIETDGRRVVSVSGGVLRVVDAASHKTTGRLDLSMYSGAESAQLLMSGDRVLVILGDAVPYYGGPVYDGLPSPVRSASATFLLVDLTAAPRIVSTLHPHGGYVDARMVDGTVRLVVQSAPKLAFPMPADGRTTATTIAANRAIVAHAPLSAWLPTYDVTTGGATTTQTVPCGRVSHPPTYSGTSMLTIYTVDLAASLDDPQPVSLAADSTSVYATPSSLYVASADGAKTQLHRFDISAPGRPVYLGSGIIPGQLFDSYSMSDYDGSLRVVTTTYRRQTSTSVYVLDAGTLRVTGSVGGLGVGEQLHGVRFLGPLAYVVTFESVDPLYVLDLHDPARPRKAGALEITGYSDYLHPVASGRLLGVGESVDPTGVVSGLQVSLFDVATPAHPQRIDRIVRTHSPSEAPIDPHAFLYWPAAHLAVMPIDSWNADESGAALVVHVGTDNLKTVGTIRNPAVSSTDGYDSGIERTLVIGSDIWTMSSSGLQVSDLHSLTRRAWVPFS
jgi:uncharacterized secreted protein with C-terminal beta-propeller domain